MNLTLTRSGKFGIETSGKRPIAEARFTSLANARTCASTAAAAINDRLDAFVRFEGSHTLATEADALGEAARIVLSMASNPYIDRLDLLDLDNQIGDIYRDAKRAANAGLLDDDALFEIKSTLWTIRDLVDDQDDWLANNAEHIDCPQHFEG
jgi:hypothetical protein